MRIIHVLRKPLSEGTVAANTLKHGTGGLNINASRIASPGEEITTHTQGRGDDGFAANAVYGDYRGGFSTHQTEGQKLGRWPANVILQHLDGCRCAGIKRVRATPIHGESIAVRRSGVHHTAGGHQSVGRKQPVTGHADKDGKETIANWVCGPGCPVARLDEQSGVTTSTGGRTVNISTTSTIYGGGKGLGQRLSSDDVRGDPGFGDTGGASRFYKQIGGKENA